MCAEGIGRGFLNGRLLFKNCLGLVDSFVCYIPFNWAFFLLGEILWCNFMQSFCTTWRGMDSLRWRQQRRKVAPCCLFFIGYLLAAQKILLPCVFMWLSTFFYLGSCLFGWVLFISYIFFVLFSLIVDSTPGTNVVLSNKYGVRVHAETGSCYFDLPARVTHKRFRRRWKNLVKR